MGIQRGLISPQRRLVILGLLASAALMGYSGLLHAQEAAEQETAETEIQDTVATEAPATEPQSTGQTRGNRVVSLQTTVTGNQEQPRVLYLIPWQSPRASDADFEQFDGLQTPVFGHLERDEFRRELEARGEFD